MRGAKPTPTVLKVLRGNPGRRPLNSREPQPGALSPVTPRELTDADARREWRRTIVPAIAIGQVTAADRVVAIAHCELWATWRSQLIAAAKDGHVVGVGKRSHPMPNTARVMANKTLQLLVKIDAELGLSPTSRSRVHVSTPTTEVNPLDRFLKKSAP